MKSQIFKSDNKSTNIIEQKLIEKLVDIFNMLDSDGDGKINSTNIDVKQLSTNVIEIISPLLCEMEQLNLEYSQEQFIENAFILYKSLNITDKNKLIFDRSEKFEKVKQEEMSKYTFHPNINSQSKQIIKQMKQHQSVTDLYNRGVQFKQEKELKMMREKQMKREMET